MDYNYLKVKSYDFRVETKIGYPDMYLLSFNERQHIKVSEKAKMILDCFNGEKNIEQIQLELNNKMIPFTPDDVVKFVDDILLKNSILEGMSYDTKSKGKSYMWFHLPIIESNKLSGLFNVLKILYSKYMSIPAIGIIVFCSIFSIYNALMIETTSNQVNSLVLILIIYLSLILHEFGHISAAYRYGIKVGYLGIGLYLFNPVMYVDMTNVWRLDYKKRVVVDVGGMYFQLITVIPITIVAILSQNSFLYIINITIITVTMANLLPFIKLDGYWMLCDYLEIDNIASNAFGIVFGYIKNVFSKTKDHHSYKSKSKIYVIFAFIYMISTVLVVIFGLSLSLNVIRDLHIIKDNFFDIYQNVKNGNIQLAFSILNQVFVFMLPLVFLIYVIVKIIFNITKSIIFGGKDK